MTEQFGTSTSRLLIVVCVFLVSIAALSCSRGVGLPKRVTFVAHVLSPDPTAQVYLSGSTPALGSWSATGVAMMRLGDSLWSVTVSLPFGEDIEYKVTAGSWWSEAVDSTGNIYQNFRLRVAGDTTVTVLAYGWLNRMAGDRPVIDANRFRPGRPPLVLDGLWRYRPGDSLQWARTELPDDDWSIADPLMRWDEVSDLPWTGVGWFRFRFIADTSIWGRTLAFSISQLGASEIYYNGRLIRTSGEIGTPDRASVPFQDRAWSELRIDSQSSQVIAVRYANAEAPTQRPMNIEPGFLITVRDLGQVLRDAPQTSRQLTIRQLVFTLIPAILAFVHLFLFGFSRTLRQHLYYGVCLIGFAGVTYFNFAGRFMEIPSEIIMAFRLANIFAFVAIFFGMLTIGSMSYARLPRRWWGFLLLFLGLIGVTFLDLDVRLVGVLTYVFFGLATLEGIIAAFRGDAPKKRGGWFLLTGYFILNLLVFLQILMDYSVIPRVGDGRLYIYGMLGLAVCMSMYLAYEFGWINKDLALQLENVKKLSAAAVEQERTAARLEAERRIVEAENARKSQELESARQLQMSLLPGSIPRREGFDIACFMKTATEVGGDYYDIFEDGRGGLTAVVGDATGHGLKAGNMVIVTKGLLNVLSGGEDLAEILRTANGAIKRMRLHMLTMCLAISRFDGRKLTYSSAGMPPLLVFRAGTGRVEQHVLKAMPLGATADFAYQSLTTELSAGDAAVMISDGLMEMFDPTRETYGMENVLRSLERHASATAQGIVDGLVADANTWAKGTPLADDLTVVVMKVTT